MDMTWLLVVDVLDIKVKMIDFSSVARMDIAKLLFIWEAQVFIVVVGMLCL